MNLIRFIALLFIAATATVRGATIPPAGGGTTVVTTNGMLEAQVRSAIASSNATERATTFASIRDAQGSDLWPVYGVEYLAEKWFGKLTNPTNAPKVLLAGDSTTAGNAITDNDNLPDAILRRALQAASWRTPTVTNSGQSGQSAAWWVTNQLANDLAAKPDLLVWKYGANDASASLSAFSNAVRFGLQKIRFTNSLSASNLSILLVTPNQMNDSPNGRDRAWFDGVSITLRSLARQFQCAFADVGRDFLDATNLVASMDDPYGTGRHVHPKDSLNRLIWSRIADIIAPASFRPPGIISPWGYQLYADPAALPSTYPLSGSSFRARTTEGWPIDGMVLTFQQPDGVWLQFLASYTTSQIRARTGNGSGWNGWINLGTRTQETMWNPTSVEALPWVTNAPSYFTNGVTSSRARTTEGWPIDGAALTFKQADGVWLQINSGYTSGNVWFRTGNGSGWIAPFVRLGGVWAPTSPTETISAASAPTAWTNTVSLHRAIATNGWPNEGMVSTFYQPDGVWFQINSAWTSNSVAIRTGQSSGWGAWINLGSTNAIGGGGGGSSFDGKITNGTHYGSVTYGSATTSSNVIDFNAQPIQFRTLSADATFSTVNAAVGKAVRVYVYAGSTNRALTFPAPPTWEWIGTPPPALVWTNAFLQIDLTATATNVYASAAPKVYP